MIEVQIDSFCFVGYSTCVHQFEIVFNGKIIAKSGCYTRRHSAIRGAKRMIKAIQSGNVRYK